MGHLKSFLARGGGNLNKNFPKIQMPGGLPGGMLKLRFDWYISFDREPSDVAARSLVRVYRCIPSYRLVR